MHPFPFAERARPALAHLALVFLLAGLAVSALAATTPRPVAEPALPAKPADAGEQPAPGSAGNTASVDTDKLFAAIVKVEARAVPGARSLASLGRDREGSGIVIGEGGLVLTIGYLIVEAEDVRITDSRGRTLPARVVGYDHATGLGLVRTLTPVQIAPVALGDSEKVTEREPVMIASQAGSEEVNFVWVVSRRPFTGNWEYLLERAIYTSPPTMNWSGAALIDREGRLIGVGSLIVRDATANESEVPGNVFVPVEVLKPILADLEKRGRRAGPARPWLGVAADEMQGRLVVTRVSADGPADRAGLKPGDIILGVGRDPVRTQADFYRKVWARGSAGDEIPLRVLQDVDVKDVKVRSIDRVDYFRTATTY